MSWNENNLLQLIAAEQEEHIQLEFKGAGALAQTDGPKTELSKDVSSFANTIGGTILYGIAEDNSTPKRAIRIDPIDPAVFSKEWLESVINTRIQPRISGIRIGPIRLDTTHIGRVAYAVDIPQSDTAHQAYDKRYYKRFNFQTVPMEHYEVKQAMFRLSRPAYKIVLHCRTSQISGGGEFHFSATVINVSEISGHDCAILMYVPRARFGAGQFSDHELVNIGNIECVRLTGHNQVQLPPGPRVLTIDRGLSFNDTEFADPNREITIFFRIYDSFGLALFERYSMRLQNRHFTCEETIDTGRIAATILP